MSKLSYIHEMKQIYFAGTFNLHEDTAQPWSVRLANDYRALLLGSADRMVEYNDSVIMDIGGNDVHYVGPFYCEEAAIGDYTSTDCAVVVTQERKQVEQCDIIVCVFDTWPSIGTVVELEWAINLDKDILILYEIEKKNEYTLPTGLWFVIQDAMQRSKKIKAIGYNHNEDVVDIITQQLRMYISMTNNKQQEI